MRKLRSSVITASLDLVSPIIVKKSFEKMGHSNVLNRNEDDTLLEDDDSFSDIGHNDDSRSDLSASDSN